MHSAISQANTVDFCVAGMLRSGSDSQPASAGTGVSFHAFRTASSEPYFFFRNAIHFGCIMRPMKSDMLQRRFCSL